MQRYFVSREQFHEDTIEIVGDDVKHIIRVMRMREGEEIVCCDGQGSSWIVRLQDLQSDRVIGRVIRELFEQVEPAVKLTLAQSLPKGDKMDLIVQKGTELGVSSFQPLGTMRTIVEYDGKKMEKRMERWRRIAKEAAEQSHRTQIPEIRRCQGFSRWLSSLQDYDLVIMPYEGEQVRSIGEVLTQFPHVNTIGLIIGPEGGLDPAEVKQAQAAGVYTVSLGARILRTETAGLVAATVIFYHYGELGGVKK